MTGPTKLYGIIACVLGMLSWSVAQSAKPELFDSQKAQQELEIMRGILSTTLGMVSKELRTNTSTGTTAGMRFRWQTPNVGAYYLYGQGATFTIPVSSLRHFGRWFGELPDLEAAQAEMEAAQEAMRDTAERMRELGNRGTGRLQAPPAPPQLPKPPEPPRVNSEELKKSVAQAQEQVKKRREYLEQQNQKMQELIGALKGHLVDALANYGDSLTTIKPNEYINIIISTDSEDWDPLPDSNVQRASKQILSVQKSTVADYKAGRLTLDAFRQKVLQYNQ